MDKSKLKEGNSVAIIAGNRFRMDRNGSFVKYCGIWVEAILDEDKNDFYICPSSGIAHPIDDIEESPLQTYYSIRTVLAGSEDEAIEKVQDECFDESDPLCDKVMTSDEIREEFFIKK